MTALVVSGLSVTYADGTRALDGLDLDVAPGARVAVVGRSGSGKTTLVRAVLGLLPPGTTVTGSIRVGDVELLDMPERQLRRIRGPVIGYVPQDPFAACDPLRTVAHHIEEAWRAHRIRPPDGAVAAGLTDVGIPAERAGQYPHQWSGGMLQRATLLAATAHAPLLTIADEPTSALDAELADDVLTLIRRRCGALLLISHDRDLVARHTDAVVELSEGRVVDRGKPPRATERRAVTATAAPEPATPVVVEATGITRRYGSVTAVDAASITVRAGEIVGVMGRSGSGKSTLARLVGGMERPDSGTVRIADPHRPGFVMPVFQDPVAGLDRRWPIWRTLTEPLTAKGERHPRRDRKELAVEALDRVGLKGIDVDRLPGSLSVGQAQRVAVARALMARPALLIADEPTASLDVTSAAEIAALLRDVADAGTAMLVVSHDRERLETFADRILCMADGRLTHPREPSS